MPKGLIMRTISCGARNCSLIPHSELGEGAFQPIYEPISYSEELESQVFLQFSQSLKSNSEFWKKIAVLNMDAEVVVAKNKGSCLFIPSPRISLLHRAGVWRGSVNHKQKLIPP